MRALSPTQGLRGVPILRHYITSADSHEYSRQSRVAARWKFGEVVTLVLLTFLGFGALLFFLFCTDT